MTNKTTIRTSTARCFRATTAKTDGTTNAKNGTVCTRRSGAAFRCRVRYTRPANTFRKIFGTRGKISNKTTATSRCYKTTFRSFNFTNLLSNGYKGRYSRKSTTTNTPRNHRTTFHTARNRVATAKDADKISRTRKVVRKAATKATNRCRTVARNRATRTATNGTVFSTNRAFNGASFAFGTAHYTKKLTNATTKTTVNTKTTSGYADFLCSTGYSTTVATTRRTATATLKRAA